MTKKIGLFISTSLLLVLLCGMTMRPVTVSAAEQRDGCGHPTLKLVSTSVSYPNATDSTHQKVTTRIYECSSCGQGFKNENTVSEAHSFPAGSRVCECGYVWH